MITNTPRTSGNLMTLGGLLHGTYPTDRDTLEVDGVTLGDLRRLQLDWDASYFERIAE